MCVCVCVCVLTEMYFDCVCVLSFVMGYVFQLGKIAPKRIRYYYYYYLCAKWHRLM